MKNRKTVATAARCSKCNVTFADENGLRLHLRDSSKHKDHPDNRYYGSLQQTSDASPRKTKASSPSKGGGAGLFTRQPAVVLAKPKPPQPASLARREGGPVKPYKHQKTHTEKRNKLFKRSAATLISDDGQPGELDNKPPLAVSATMEIGTSASMQEPGAVMQEPGAVEAGNAPSIDATVSDTCSESDDGADYFTPDDGDNQSEADNTSDSVAQAVAQVSLNSTSTASVDQESIAKQDPLPTDQALDSCNEQLDVPVERRPPTPPTSESLAPSQSASQAASRPVTWTEVISSNIPRDLYAMLDSGAVHCVPCSKVFANFRAFKRHYQEAPAHTFEGKGSSTRRHQASSGPPPLIRSEPSAPRRGDARPHNNTSSGHAVLRGSRSEPLHNDSECEKCRLFFVDRTALQRHNAETVSAHPYYCPFCCVEFANLEQLQSHITTSSQCQPPPVGPTSGSHALTMQEYYTGSNPRAGPGPASYGRGRRGAKGPIEQMLFCPICMNPITDDVDVSATFCGHIFCAPCILEHLRLKNNCPTCRALLSPMLLSGSS